MEACFLASNMIFCKMVKNVRSLKFRLAALFRIKDFELPAQKTNFQLKIQASQKFKFQASVQNLGCQPKILASRRFRVCMKKVSKSAGNSVIVQPIQ